MLTDNYKTPSKSVSTTTIENSVVFTNNNLQGQFYFVDATGEITVTLEDVVDCIDGASATFRTLNAQVLNIRPDATDRIINSDGTVLAVGNKLTSSGAAGDQVTILKDSLSGWSVVGRGEQAWTDGGA